jgi:hypothetical protein
LDAQSSNAIHEKVIKDCATLQISETAYEFNTTTVFRIKMSDQPSIPEQEAHIWASGKLNRIPGEFSADQRMRGSNGDSFRLYCLENDLCARAAEILMKAAALCSEAAD